MSSSHGSVRLLPRERWWGGAVQDGSEMPFGGGVYERDLRCSSGGNQSAPFLVSSAGRYVWCEGPFRLAFDGCELELEGDGHPIVVGEGLGNLRGAYLEACSRFFPPSGGTPSEVCLDSPQYNTWIEMGHEPTQEKVLQYAESILDNGFPPGLIILDDGWAEDYGSWRFHPGRFGDPRAMMRRLSDLGFKVMLWVCPFVSPDSPVYRSLAERELLLCDRTGDPAIRKWWNGHSAILDCSNPMAASWLCARLDSLAADFGVEGFKFDGGDLEYYRPDDRGCRAASAVEHCEAWARIGLRYPAGELRACWKLGGKRLIQRLRDKHHVWGRNGLADLIPNGLAQGLDGYAFTCPDMIGGGDIAFVSEDKIDRELFVRTAQCSALFPMMQFSIAPWRVLDEASLDIVREAVRLRQTFVSEIFRLAHHASTTGEPILRHLAYVFPEGAYESIGDQAMLGNEVLIAPVTVQGAEKRPVVFPPGLWQPMEGDPIAGPCEREVEAPPSRLPWFRRIG